LLIGPWTRTGPGYRQDDNFRTPTLRWLGRKLLGARQSGAILFCERRAKSEQSVPPDRQSEHMRDRWWLVVVLTLLLALTVIATIFNTPGGPSRSRDSSLETVVVPGVHSVGVAVSMQGHAECVRVIDRLV
jgi:hypothetical protein